MWVLLPATLLLAAMAAFDARAGRLAALAIGCLAGLLAAAAYDVSAVFRLAKPWGSIADPHNAAFKVFRAGALLLGQPLEQDSTAPRRRWVDFTAWGGAA